MYKDHPPYTKMTQIHEKFKVCTPYPHIPARSSHIATEESGWGGWEQSLVLGLTGRGKAEASGSESTVGIKGSCIMKEEMVGER